MCIYIYIYTHIHIICMCMYIYIYIYVSPCCDAACTLYAPRCTLRDLPHVARCVAYVEYNATCSCVCRVCVCVCVVVKSCASMCVMYMCIHDTRIITVHRITSHCNAPRHIESHHAISHRIASHHTIYLNGTGVCEKELSS